MKLSLIPFPVYIICVFIFRNTIRRKELYSFLEFCTVGLIILDVPEGRHGFGSSSVIPQVGDCI